MTKKSSKKKKNSGGLSGWSRAHSLGLLYAGASVVVIAVAAVVFCLQGYKGESQWIYIPESATASAVRDSLRIHLGSVEANRIYMLWKLQGGDAATAHGAYLIEDGQKSLATSRRLLRGLQTPVKVSFSNVRTLPQLAERVTAPLECSSEDFLEACRTVLPDSGFVKEQFPAAFIPDTYEFYWTTDASRLVKRLLDYRNRFWTPERRSQARALGLTPVEVATIASIVEEESTKGDERPKIARLYLNRLGIRMPLQADPTVKFASGDFSLRRITGEHLNIESPYNTYRHAGLPPGPIRIASKSAIDNVLDAPQHPYLYMCAKEDFSGYHNFASDYATHMANARRYQAELNRRNIH